MPGFDKREVAYTQAREELMKRMRESGISYLDEPDRGDRIAHIVRGIAEEFPDLDEQMSRRLVGEAMRRQPEAGDAPPDGEI